MYSGQQSYSEVESTALAGFKRQTNIKFEISSIDTAVYKNEWKGVSPICEVVLSTFPRKVNKPAFLLVG